MTKKWFYVLGFIGFVIQFAGLLILGGVLLLSKWNLITRYPVIFNFRVGTGWVLEKKFGTGRVPRSRQTLPTIIRSGCCLLCQVKWKPLSASYCLLNVFTPRPLARVGGVTFRSSGKGNWNGKRRVLGAGMKVDSRNLGMRQNKKKSVPFWD